MNACGAFAVVLFIVGAFGATAGQAAGAKATPGSHAHASVHAAQPGKSKSSLSAAATANSGGGARRSAPAGSRSPPKPTHALDHTWAGDLLSAAVISDKELAKDRGGTETNSTNNTTGTVGGNVASQLTTGANTISQGSFANSSGIPIVIQNTGNNVLIQNSTILNLQLTKP